MAGIYQDLDLTRTQLAVFFVVLLLSIDEINPVKIILHVFPSISPWHVATLSGLLMLYVFLSEMKQLVYFAIKIFFHSIISIFFREVSVIGRENIPRYGPVIFTINHANQFMDAVMVMVTCQHKISYLMAEASWKRRIIGDIAWAMGVVPVKRAQDDAKPGNGLITMQEQQQQKSNDEEEETKRILVQGTGTKFTQELARGDKIRPPGTAVAFKVLEVKSDTEAILDGIDLPHDFVLPNKEPLTFDVLKKVDTRIVFEKVLEKLANLGAVGIFPEGGSHDRTELLPLKAGIALIAYSALDEDDLNVPIVPIGLNYFRAHRWRGRAVIEYGRPILIDPATLPDYQAGGLRKRQVCNQLLDDIETSMLSVIVSAPDYETLELIHTARRLYQRKKGPLDASEKQDLSRRFAEGYKMLMLQTNGNPPQEWLDLQQRIIDYRNELKDLGLKDYQVPGLTEEHLDDEINVENVDGDKLLSFMQLPYQIVHFVFLITLAAVPVLFLNLPVGLLAGLYAERRRKKALAKSKVKVKGFDVMLTEKIVFCMVMVPAFWISYGLCLYFFTDLDIPTISLAFFSMPLFAYMGIIVSEAGMVSFNDLRPYFMRLFPSTRRRLAKLPKTRKVLQDDLRAFIKKIGPGLGDIYSKDELDWKAIWDQSKQLEDAEDETKKDR